MRFKENPFYAGTTFGIFAFLMLFINAWVWGLFGFIVVFPLVVIYVIINKSFEENKIKVKPRKKRGRKK